ncbi:MAG TPA: hypothetical protein VND65_21080 [Candidatus Binatia bacterium]|nr:hypothetical protein [Candidatus Binatia bacterium]
MEKPELDESKAVEYLGKTILIGVTYVDQEERPLGRRQWFGTILTYSNKQGIKIKLKGSDLPCCLPPDPRGINRAKRGIYTLKSTGEQIVDPDHITACVSSRPGISEDTDFLPPGA